MTMEASGLQEYAWKLAYDAEGRIIAVPIDPPDLPRGYVEPPWKNDQDPHLDPEHARAIRARLGI